MNKSLIFSRDWVFEMLPSFWYYTAVSIQWQRFVFVLLSNWQPEIFLWIRYFEKKMSATVLCKTKRYSNEFKLIPSNHSSFDEPGKDPQFFLSRTNVVCKWVRILNISITLILPVLFDQKRNKGAWITKAFFLLTNICVKDHV